jgi:hypothetical protein
LHSNASEVQITERSLRSRIAQVGGFLEPFRRLAFILLHSNAFQIGQRQLPTRVGIGILSWLLNRGDGTPGIVAQPSEGSEQIS